MTWFIESWSVRDGFAFASEREANTADLSQTVFLGPPGFEVIPIAKVSTALAAARGHFQERLLDNDGNEVSFDTLQQIVELVRRSYLQGGSGFVPPAGPAGPEGPPRVERPRPPEDMPSGGPLSSDRPQSGQSGSSAPRPGRGGSTGSRSEIKARVRGIADDDSRALLAEAFKTRWARDADVTLLRQFVEDTAKELSRRLTVALLGNLRGREMNRLLETIGVWLELSYRLGLLDPGFNSLSLSEDEEQAFKQFGLSQWWNTNDLRTGLGQVILNGFFHWVPLLPQWRVPASSGPGFIESESLAGLINTIAADRNRLFEVVDDWISFIPVIYCCQAIACTAVAPWWYTRQYPKNPPREYFLYEVREKAAEWLAMLVPGNELDGHPSREIISSLAFEKSEAGK